VTSCTATACSDEYTWLVLEGAGQEAAPAEPESDRPAELATQLGGSRRACRTAFVNGKLVERAGQVTTVPGWPGRGRVRNVAVAAIINEPATAWARTIGPHADRLTSRVREVSERMAPHEGEARGPAPKSVGIGPGLFGVGLGWPMRWGGSDSTLTVLVALGANLLVAVAKSVAAVITGSASLTAEAAHSWADTGNELFLVVANRRSSRPPDQAHPLGHGREAYVWSMFAALGLFVAGGAVSIIHGVNELRAPTPADDFAVGYLVLAISFVLEGTSLLRSIRQANTEARALRRDLIEHVLATSDPTLRAVFAEDVAALIGLILAAAGLAARQLSGSVIPDAVGSILIGVLLVVVALQLINRNRRFLVGEEADPRLRVAVLRALLDMPEVSKVSYLRLEVVGPRLIAITGAVDLIGDDVESHVAVRLRALEDKISTSPAVAGALFSLSAPDEPPVLP